MLKSDIFFLYPPGYSGNYLQWAINASEVDLKKSTIQDPLLEDGTTHGFIRKPTHISVIPLLVWMIKNQPVQPQTFIVNAFQDSKSWNVHAAYSCHLLLNSKPNSYVVNINATDDDDVKYGALNTYTKWPTFFAANVMVNYDFDIWGSGKPVSIKDRNFLFANWRKLFPTNPKIIWEELEQNLNMQRQWFKARNSLQPWEVNKEQYTVWESTPTARILDISLKDITTDNFIKSTFAPWIESKHIGTFNWEWVNQYHSRYILAQKNMQWYQSIKRFREESVVDQYLLSNTLAQAFLLEEIADLLSDLKGWENLDCNDIIKYFGFLPSNQAG